MRRLLRILVESAVGNVLLWMIVAGIGLGVGALAAGYSNLSTPWNVLAFLGFGLAAGATSLVLIGFGVAVAASRLPHSPPSPDDERVRDLRGLLMGVRAELNHLRQRVREWMPPDDSVEWYPPDPEHEAPLSMGVWGESAGLLRRERELHSTYLVIEAAYEQVGRLERTRERVWHFEYAAAASHGVPPRRQIALSTIDDPTDEPFGDTLTALRKAIEAIDEQLESL